MYSNEDNDRIGGGGAGVNAFSHSNSIDAGTDDVLIIKHRR